MNRVVTLFVTSSTIFITACATIYQPMGFTGGYSDVQLDKNTIQVTFRGNAYVSRETVSTYLLYRCAETTVEHGFDYFVIVDRDVDVTHGAITTAGHYSGTTYYSGGGTAWTHGTYTPGQTVPYRKYGITAVIKMYKGEKPEDLPNAYNAKELMGYLEPNIVRHQNCCCLGTSRR